MSDTIKAWSEMQEEKLASLQADETLAKMLKNKEKRKTQKQYEQNKDV